MTPAEAKLLAVLLRDTRQWHPLAEFAGRRNPWVVQRMVLRLRDRGLVEYDRWAGTHGRCRAAITGTRGPTTGGRDDTK